MMIEQLNKQLKAKNPYLKYKNNSLYLENIDLSAIAKDLNNHFIAYSKQDILKNFNIYKNSCKIFGSSLICYSVKANSNLSLLKLLKDAGAGFDVVSTNELKRVLTLDADPKKIIFSGVSKTAEDLELAINTGIKCINVESLSELQLIAVTAQKLEKTANLSLRVNPDIDAKTHPYISTGLYTAKFGIPIEDVYEIYTSFSKKPYVNFVGIDSHIGSQITEITPYINTLDKLLDLYLKLKQHDIKIKHLDLGGGIGIDYQGEDTIAISDFCEQIKQTLASRLNTVQVAELEIIFEPGRSIIGNSGILVGQVIHTKTNYNPNNKQDKKNFALTNCGMQNILRPMLYKAVHKLVPLEFQSQLYEDIKWDFAGPICESSDVIACDVDFSPKQNSLFAILSAGAYVSSIASNYNSLPKINEILIEDNNYQLVASEQKFDAIIADELKYL